MRKLDFIGTVRSNLMLFEWAKELLLEETEP